MRPLLLLLLLQLPLLLQVARHCRRRGEVGLCRRFTAAASRQRLALPAHQALQVELGHGLGLLLRLLAVPLAARAVLRAIDLGVVGIGCCRRRRVSNVNWPQPLPAALRGGGSGQRCRCCISSCCKAGSRERRDAAALRGGKGADALVLLLHCAALQRRNVTLGSAPPGGGDAAASALYLLLLRHLVLLLPLAMGLPAATSGGAAAAHPFRQGQRGAPQRQQAGIQAGEGTWGRSGSVPAMQGAGGASAAAAATTKDGAATARGGGAQRALLLPAQGVGRAHQRVPAVCAEEGGGGRGQGVGCVQLCSRSGINVPGGCQAAASRRSCTAALHRKHTTAQH